VLSRFAFRVPLPPGRLALTVIAGLAWRSWSRRWTEPCTSGDLAACIVLAARACDLCGPCWLFDISRIRGRLKHGLAAFRTRFANNNIG
jgi:hypothetical protein